MFPFVPTGHFLLHAGAAGSYPHHCCGMAMRLLLRLWHPSERKSVWRLYQTVWGGTWWGVPSPVGVWWGTVRCLLSLGGTLYGTTSVVAPWQDITWCPLQCPVEGHGTVSPLLWSCGGILHSNLMVGCLWNTAWCPLNHGPAVRCCTMPSPLKVRAQARTPLLCTLLLISKRHAPCRPSSPLSSPSWLSWALPPASSSRAWA